MVNYKNNNLPIARIVGTKFITARKTTIQFTGEVKHITVEIQYVNTQIK